MKRFALAGVLAVVLGLGAAGRADAQIVYGYNTYAPGGVASYGTMVGPFGYKNVGTYYSPWTGTYQQQVYGANLWGNSYGSSSFYNPWVGGVRTGYYQPNPFYSPFGGYNYGYYRRW